MNTNTRKSLREPNKNSQTGIHGSLEREAAPEPVRNLIRVFLEAAAPEGLTSLNSAPPVGGAELVQPFSTFSVHSYRSPCSIKVPLESLSWASSPSASSPSPSSPSRSQMTVMGLLRMRLRALYLLLAAEGGVRERP